MTELYIIGSIFIAMYLASRWVIKRLPETCHCDESEQGRNCTEELCQCKPPHLPRSEK